MDTQYQYNKVNTPQPSLHSFTVHRGQEVDGFVKGNDDLKGRTAVTIRNWQQLKKTGRQRLQECPPEPVSHSPAFQLM